MARTRIVVNLETGERSIVPYTSEEESAADAAYASEQAALAANNEGDAPSPVERLRQFIEANPDVRELLGF